MGEALQIRVSAVTWNEDLVEKMWPKLSELAETVPFRYDKRGVLELVQALSEGMRFLDWPEKQKAKLETGIQEAVKVKHALEEALAKWKPSEANTLSVQLEDILDKLERA